jgi:hypothetical protein
MEPKAAELVENVAPGMVLPVLGVEDLPEEAHRLDVPLACRLGDEDLQLRGVGWPLTRRRQLPLDPGSVHGLGEWAVFRLRVLAAAREPAVDRP